jgi:preprotein translocase subunit SecA
MDHLDAMEHLRQSVNLRAYGQRDPLVEYKKEALHMYKSLDGQIKHDAVLFIENMEGIFAMNQASSQQASNGEQGGEAPAGEAMHSTSETVENKTNEKLGRNDACPCGSGKKVKKCDCIEFADLRK